MQDLNGCCKSEIKPLAGSQKAHSDISEVRAEAFQAKDLPSPASCFSKNPKLMGSPEGGDVGNTPFP